MKKTYIYKLIALLVCLFKIVACTTNQFNTLETLDSETQYFYSTINVTIPDYNHPTTRVRQTKNQINNLTVLVFNEYNRLIYRAETKLKEKKYRW